VPNPNQVLGDYDTQRRLSELEARLSRTAQANIDVQASGMTRSGGTPPTLSGLVVSTSPGQIIVSWNPATIPDVRYYELSIAVAGDTTGNSYVRLSSPRYTFAGLDGVTYTFQVRVVNQAGNAGGWSNTGSSAPGLVTTSGLDTIAATAIYRYEQVSGFQTLDPRNIGFLATETTTHGPVSITIDDANSIVSPRVFLNAAIHTAFDPSVTDSNMTIGLATYLLRNGVVIDESIMDIQSTFDSNALELPSFASYDQPGVGTHVYEFRIVASCFTTDGTTTVDVLANNVLMEFIVNKR
jgi:hypothetical protein